MKTLLKRVYYSIIWIHPIWLNVVNKKRKALLERYPAMQVNKGILHDLSEYGIAISDTEELFGKGALEALQKEAHILRDAAIPSTKKTFLLELLPRNPVLGSGSLFSKLTLGRNIVDTISAYIGVLPHFYLYTLNVTMPIKGEAISSQRWHRDPEDKKFCKMFIYLTDVDETAGPFMYVMKSNYGNKYRGMFPQRPPFGTYPPDGAVENEIYATDLKVCTGKAGTVIFCDTSGLHKGGYATEKERIMFTAGYITNASSWVQQFTTKGQFTDFEQAVLER